MPRDDAKSKKSAASAGTDAKQPDDVQTSYADDIARIQQLISMLSQKDCDIDKMLDYVNEATEIIARCQSKLARTGIQVEEALNRLDSMKAT